MTDFTSESNILPRRFTIDIELQKPAEHALTERFLAALTRLRKIEGTSRLESAFLAWSTRMREAVAA